MQEYGSCKGSREGTRGYSCGLWLLLHSLAAHVKPEASGGAFFMASLRWSPLYLAIICTHLATRSA